MSEKRKRPFTIQVRVSAEERDAIAIAANAAGQDIPDFVRANLLGVRRVRSLSGGQPRALAGLMGKLVQIQQAVLNLGEAAQDPSIVPPSVIARVIEELRAVRSAIVAVHDGAGADE